MADDIHWFAETGQIEQLREAIASGSDVNAPDEEGRAALHIAVVRLRIDAAEILINAGADLESPEHTGPGYRALHRACIPKQDRPTSDYVELIRFLLEKGAEPSSRNERGETPLHLAVSWCDVDLLDLFVEKRVDVRAADDDGRVPLHVACRRGSVSDAETLLTEGAAPTAAPPPRRDTARARLEDEYVLKALLAEGADSNAATKSGLTPLHVAAERGTTWAARILLAQGANMNAADEYGATPIHRARNGEMAEVLLDGGALMDVQDRDGNSPLHRAVGSGRVEVADVLLLRSASVLTSNHDGKTALHVAAAAGRAQTVEKLLDGGGDVNARDQSGCTPLFIAERANHSHVVSTLKRRGGKSRPKRFLFFDLQ